MVEYQQVCKAYPDGTQAVSDFSLQVEPGQIVVLIGPSGCGKTTLLKMTNRLEEASSGSILLGGRDISSINPNSLRRGIGYVIQETGLMPHLTVTENIATVPKLLGWNAKRIQQRVEALLELAGLEPDIYRYRLPAQLSGGQRQRIGVLRALAAEPDVVLMDEPFGALDPITRERLQQELLELQQSLKKTIIFVTHDIDEAIKLADTIVLMRRGKVEQIGSPSALQTQPNNAFVRSFIGEDRLAQISPHSPIHDLVEDAPCVLPSDASPRQALETLNTHGRETAQVVDARSQRWQGMVYLSDVSRAHEQQQSLKSILRSKRCLQRDQATLRQAAELLLDESVPIAVLHEDKLVGIVSDAGMARLTLARLTRATH